MFNLENFDLKLDTDFIGRNFYYIKEVDSTNDFLMKSDEIKEHGSVVLAENQLKGKGRNGRTWTTVSEKNLTFNVTHFTNYTAGENTNLTIWDDTDSKGGSQTRYNGERIMFFSNYTNRTSKIPVNGSGVYCKIDFEKRTRKRKS